MKRICIEIQLIHLVMSFFCFQEWLWLLVLWEMISWNWCDGLLPMFEDGIIHYMIIALQMKQSHNSYRPNINGIIHSIEETTQNCPTRDSHSFLLHILLFVKPFHCDSNYTNNKEDDMSHELNWVEVSSLSVIIVIDKSLTTINESKQMKLQW